MKYKNKRLKQKWKKTNKEKKGFMLMDYCNGLKESKGSLGDNNSEGSFF